MYHSAHVEVRGQLCGIGSLLLPSQVLGLRKCQALWKCLYLLIHLREPCLWTRGSVRILCGFLEGSAKA